MSENQIPAPIIATQNNANETQRNETNNNATEIPQIKPKIYATIKEAIDAGATQIVINRRGAIYKFTPEQFPQLLERQKQLQKQVYNILTIELTFCLIWLHIYYHTSTI